MPSDQSFPKAEFTSWEMFELLIADGASHVNKYVLAAFSLLRVRSTVSLIETHIFLSESAFQMSAILKHSIYRHKNSSS